MGSFFSTLSTRNAAAGDPENIQAALQHLTLHPAAADGIQIWYAEFFEKAYCVPHMNGKGVIICCPDDRFVQDPREQDGWPVENVKILYERLGESKECARIVRYVYP
ncbi:hypothetical protein BCR34DRAFT_353819 [Clohesyomyces aquaticus]|uniref:Uncharacterized protein n=1 Tax=Clohesyomyces aquaticus TaxID=1231657 RepID=A0A1Y1ZJ11_9PLEO|nr:hypothetical protein BCR34DRAFT_353819 [Clohesyomyces aquaticus]